VQDRPVGDEGRQNLQTAVTTVGETVLQAFASLPPLCHPERRKPIRLRVARLVGEDAGTQQVLRLRKPNPDIESRGKNAESNNPNGEWQSREARVSHR